MLISKLHSRRREIATTVLAVFSIVFVCDTLCDQEVIKMGRLEQSAHSHEHASSQHSHNGDDHHSESSGYDSEGISHQQGGEEDDECCAEESSKFYASLIKHEAPQFSLNQIVITEAWSSIGSVSFYYKDTNPYRLNSTLSPPSGLFARILFQSFLC